jgi:signal peptidase I
LSSRRRARRRACGLEIIGRWQWRKPAVPTKLCDLLRAPMSKPQKKHVRRMGPVRDNLEAFGVAILAAVLLKWFCIEAFQIPTSSMQPTLMGDVYAGVYDRILVDKIRYLLHEPQRWDVGVFRYPLQKNQSYVKRILGTPGDRLHIAGGNVHFVTDRNGKREYTTLRKPPHIQKRLWKEVFPARMRLRNETSAIGPGKCFVVPASRLWKEDGGTFVCTLEQGMVGRLPFTDTEDGGFLDRVYDGYPTAVGQKIREHLPRTGTELVQDARFEVGVEPEQELDELAFEIEVLRPGKDRRVYAFVVKGGKGRLQVRERDSTVGAESPEFDCAVPAGETTALVFEHLDDELVAWRDGDELQRFDVSAWHCREGMELPPGTPGATESQKVTPQIVLKGKGGKVALHDYRLYRDQHWTRLELPVDHVIEVPAGHFYMMGDNTLQSVDSRGWTAIEIGVDGEGRVVPPKTPGARIVRGNKRPVPSTLPPDRDETPVIVASRGQIAMLDEFGEILALKARAEIAGHQGDQRLLFHAPGAQDGHGEWPPPESMVPFVPREHFQGRALVGFWPTWPFGPQRVGFIK